MRERAIVLGHSRGMPRFATPVNAQILLPAAEPALEMARRRPRDARRSSARAASRAASSSSTSASRSAKRSMRHAALARAEEFARTANPQVLPRDLEAVVVLVDHLQPLARRLRQRLLVEQDADARRRAAPDAAAQLVQLREAEALGVLDHHQRRVGHVDADLDHRRRHQHLDCAGLERLPSPPPSPPASCAPCTRPDLRARETSLRERCVGLDRGLQLQRLGFLDQRAHPVGLAARHAGVAHALRSPRRAALRQQLGRDRRAARAASRRSPTRRGRRSSSSPACAGSASRSSSAGAAARRGPRALPFSRSASRCCTPKRCCSSTIASPARELDSSWNSACVPIATMRRARGDLDQRRAFPCRLQAAREPGDRHAERREPVARICGSAARRGFRSAP